MKWRATQQINQNININSNISCAKKLGKIQPKLLDNRFRQFLRLTKEENSINHRQQVEKKQMEDSRSDG